MSRCDDCGADDAENSISGRKRCNRCALKALSAVTIDIGGPALAHELPVAPRQRQRLHNDRLVTRRRARGRAEREATKKLRLMYLSDYQTLLGEQMRLNGETPTNPRPLDIYLRQLASKRLLALVQRMDSDG